MFNVKDFGAVGNGTSDDTTAILNAVSSCQAAGGGEVYFPGSANYLISAPLALTGNGITLRGDGPASTYITVGASFSGAAAVTVTGGNSHQVQNLCIQGASAAYSSNPAAHGIQAAHTNNVSLSNLAFNYINGYGIEILSDATGDSYYPRLTDIHTYYCRGGIHLQGTASSDHLMGAFLSGVALDNSQADDGLLIEDVWDVQLTNLDSSQNLASVVHVKGGGAHTLNNMDLGSGTPWSAALLIEAGTGGSTPNGILVSNSIVQQGNFAAQITSGSMIAFTGCAFQQAQNTGVNITGGVSNVTFTGCIWSQNGKAGGSGNYDLYGNASGSVTLGNCIFNTPNGTAAGQVAYSVHFQGGPSVVTGCLFPYHNAYEPGYAPARTSGNQGDGRSTPYAVTSTTPVTAANMATAKMVSPVITVPGGSTAAGSSYKVTVQGNFGVVSGTSPSLKLMLMWGGASGVSLVSVTLPTGNHPGPGVGQFNVTFTAGFTSPTSVYAGAFGAVYPPSAFAFVQFTNPTTVVSSVSKDIGVAALWDTANAANSITVTSATVEQIG